MVSSLFAPPFLFKQRFPLALMLCLAATVIAPGAAGQSAGKEPLSGRRTSPFTIPPDHVFLPGPHHLRKLFLHERGDVMNDPSIDAWLKAEDVRDPLYSDECLIDVSDVLRQVSRRR
jgi:hypothetical protein